jgi:RHH-type rel operon transcriptional repressor/antitoxin RelB
MTEHIVRLPDGIYEKVKAVAGDAGQSPDELILAVLLQHFEDMEDIQAAEAAIAEWEADGRRTIPLEQVSRELGLDD